MGYRYFHLRINSVNDASILCKNFVKFGPVTPELTERQVRHGQKLAHLVEYRRTDFRNLFIIIMKALYVQTMDLYLIYQFFKGRCHGNQIMLRKCYQRRLIPRAFVALVLENELQYHSLSVRIDSANDATISRENLVKFAPVSPELTELICERQVRISPDILDRFSQYFYHIKALCVQMMDMYLIFQFVKGRCHSNQIMLP